MSADDDLFGNSRKYRSISFRGEPPVSHRNLKVLDYIEKVQARDPETGDKKYFKIRGTNQDDLDAPIWQWVITVELPRDHPHRGDRDIIDEYGEDDGVRYLYVGGKADPASRSSRAALAQALRKAGVKRVEPGGIIEEFTYVADGQKAPGASRVSNPPKQYRATYLPPSRNGNGNDETVLDRSQRRQHEERERASVGSRAAADEPPF